jgi:hypothetical protein
MHAFTVSTAHGETTFIDEARQQLLGMEVTVRGWVTVPSHVFSSATGEGFAIQDNQAGIYVLIDDPSLNLVLNQRVRVTGKVQDDGFGLLILDPNGTGAVEMLTNPKQIAPQKFTTCQINEATEGLLVHVVGTVQLFQENPPLVIRDDLPFGYGIFINSDPNNLSCERQVFIHASTGINPHDAQFSFIQEGLQIQVTGFSGQFILGPTDPNYEVNPRSQNDIQPAP